MSAVSVAREFFHRSGIGIDQLPPANDKLFPVDDEAEKQRATQVSRDFGAVLRGLVESTTDRCFASFGCAPLLRPANEVWRL